MKLKKILLTAAITAAMVVTSVVPALAETAVNEPAGEADIMVISPAPVAEWTSASLKAAKVSLTSVKSYRYDKVKLT